MIACAECGCKASEGWALYCVKCTDKQQDVDWEAVAADQAMTIAMMKAEEKPICPHCKTKMKPVNDLSDYSPSAYWQCECETLPNAEIDYGKYSGF